MDVVNGCCAGLDVHKKVVVACRMRSGPDGQPEREVASFSTMTADLLRLADWLKAWGCTHVAMESTGEYWRPVYNLLEEQFTLLLVNPQHVHQVPGRKTDVGDAEWLATLLRYGLLAASFVPPPAQRDLRDLTRTRAALVRDRTRVVNRVQKVLEDANIKLAAVVSDIQGVSARAMLAAMLEGQEDAAALAALARGQLRAKIPQLVEALTGRVRDHHRLLLAHHLTHLDFLDEEIAALTAAVEEQVEAMSAPPADQDPSDAAGGAPDRPLSPREAVALLDTIPGVSAEGAQSMVAELGSDVGHFPSATHVASWAGLAPGNHESAGRRTSGRTTKGNKVLRTLCVQAAWAAVRGKDCYLKAQYHHLVGRRGKKRAIMAVAHSIVVIAYHLLARREPYRDLGADYYDRRAKETVTRRLVARLEGLGYAVQLQPHPAAPQGPAPECAAQSAHRALPPPPGPAVAPAPSCC